MLTQNTMPRVGYAFVPVQKFGETYSIEEGFSRGTLFPELDLPKNVYMGGLMHD